MGLERTAQSAKRNKHIKQQSISGKNMYNKEIHLKTEEGDLLGEEGQMGYLINQSLD